MFTPLITHDLDGAALAAPVDAARRNGAVYKTRTIDDLRIKDDRLRAAIEGTGHLLFDGEVHDAQSRPTCNICRMREHCRFRAAHTTCYSSH